MAQLEKCLPSPGLLLSTVQTGVVVHTCKSQEAEAGEPEVQDHPWLHREFKYSLGWFFFFLNSVNILIHFYRMVNKPSFPMSFESLI